jgi:RNA-binding protein YlmH
LNQVRRTAVTLDLIEEVAELIPNIKFDKIKGNVASIRLDSVIGEGLKMSRSQVVNQIAAGKVFVNGKLITSNAYNLKENDIISIRGTGRLSYHGILSETKKGRFVVSIHKYGN